jgi:hypothetical protein
MIVYNNYIQGLKGKGYTPFIAIVKWTPEERSTAITRFSQAFDTPEGQGVTGVHTWNLVGRNTMIVIGWMNSPISLQKFCAAITFGTGLTMEIFPAIDHSDLKTALGGLKPLGLRARRARR